MSKSGVKKDQDQNSYHRQLEKKTKKELLDMYLELEQKYEQLLKQSPGTPGVEATGKPDERSRFFAHISHQFRTPLTLIIGPLEELLSQCHEPLQKRTLSMMIRNAQRLQGLINQFLELSKLESGQLTLKACRQNIIPLVKAIIEAFTLLAEQCEVMLTFHAEKEDITLYYESGRIEEVICNLLISALKFTPPGGQIRVSVRDSDPDFVEVSVYDTGPSIPPEQLTSIFDRFFQLEQTFEHQRKGLGIGLALAKEFIALHRGMLDIKSGETEGTEFVIRLPKGNAHLKPGEFVEPSVSPAVPPEDGKISKNYAILLELEKESFEPAAGEITYTAPSKQKRDSVLVVEDSHDMRRFIKIVLQHAFHILEAENGREGIAMAKELVPDIIISDIIMPETDGYELCRTLKADIKTSHIPIILLTAKASEADVIRGLEAGADDYVSKPFNAQILLTRLKNLVDLRRQLHLKFQRQMTMKPDKISVSSLDQTFLKQLEAAMEKNLSDSYFGVDELSDALHVSRATLHRKVSALTGESPKRLIQSYRLNRAAQLLASNYGNITEVAYKVGFSSSAYFTKCFKEQFHRLPSDYGKP